MGELSDKIGKQGREMLIKAAKAQIEGLDYVIETHAKNGDVTAADEARVRQNQLKQELAALEAEQN